jgi:peroxiredoxin
MKRRAIWLVGVAVLWWGTAALCAAASNGGAELIGTKALNWNVSEWLNSQPLSLEQLRGRVALVRWWTGPECPYCAASAPALNTFYERYHAKGLVVIGFYHHKSPAPLTRQHVEQLVKRYQFQFPVAIDSGWRTLKRWWLDGHDRAWTSVSFLLDQDGVIRYVHPGGSYTEEEMKTLTSLIETLLAGRPQGLAAAVSKRLE